MTCLTKSAIFLIEAYQKWLSPRKGFKCAHGQACAELTCSAYGKAMFRNHGFLTALVKTHQRIEACGEVARLLSAPPRRHKKVSQGGFVDGDCGGCDGCDAPDCKGCDMPSCDVPHCSPASSFSKCGWLNVADCGCDLAEGLFTFNKGSVFRVGPLVNGNDVYKHKKSGKYYEVDPLASKDWTDEEVLTKNGLSLTKKEVKEKLGKRKSTDPLN